MQQLLDNRKALRDAGWQIQDAADSKAGTAVKAADPTAASAAGSDDSDGGGDVPDAVMLLLLQRESLLAAAEREELASQREEMLARSQSIEHQIKDQVCWQLCDQHEAVMCVRLKGFR
jgi:hypothetical protein